MRSFPKKSITNYQRIKKTTSVGEFWQKNQSALVNLQCLDLNLSTQLIRQNLRLFGFPRLERFLNTANFVLSFPKFKDSLKEIVKRTQDTDAEFFSRLINLSDAFIRMGFKEDFEEEMNSLLTKKNLLAQEVIQKLGERLLKRFVEKIGVKTQTIQTEIEKWNLEYLSKLFEAEKQFKEEDKELLKLIIKLEFQERSFKEAILGNYQREYYTPNEREWLEEIKEYAQRVQREFQEKGIDFEKWYHYQKRKEFTVGPSPEVQREKRESFFREFQEVVINLLGSWREKKKGLLSQDKAKEVFNKIFKKYGIQFKEGEFYHPQKGKLDLREIEPVLKDFVDLIEKFYQEEKDQKVKEQIGTNLSHLQDLKNRLGDLSSELKRKGYRLLIKPWERNPGYDIFQGNYTHCCIAVENFNRGAILDYLIDFGLQVIEVKDTAEDRTIAQTFVYFTQDIRGEINLVLDNIEINSEYAGLAGEIRENLFAYLKEFALDVCPKTKRILLGTAYNDVETTELEKRNLTLSKIGGSPRKTEYLDAFGCVWVDPSREINKTFHLVGEDFIQERKIKEKKK